MKATELTPFKATHPGEILKDELEASAISQSDFAKTIGLKRSQLNEIIKGKRNLNADLAVLLEKTLGIDADYWMEAQKNFDLDVAKIKSKENKRLEAIEQMDFIKDQIAYNFLKKEKILSGDPIHDVPNVKDFYDVENFEQLANMSAQPSFARFRKSTKLKVDPVNIIGWTKLIENKAKLITVKAFDQKSEKELIENLKKVFKENENTLESTQSLLNDYGIILIYQSKGTKTPVDGISFWNKENPVIGMTLRHKRLDNFAFTLFHELGHLFKHLVNDKEGRFIDLNPKQENEDYKKSKEEKEADRFAEKNLISDAEWDGYISKYGMNPFDDSNIRLYSERIGVHPGILRGRVCHLLDFYAKKTHINNKLL